jgi:hypothetical protein
VRKQQAFVISIFRNVWMFALPLLLLSGVGENCHRKGVSSVNDGGIMEG